MCIVVLRTGMTSNQEFETSAQVEIASKQAGGVPEIDTTQEEGSESALHNSPSESPVHRRSWRMAASSNDSMVSTSEVNKLAGANNFSAWKFRMKNILMREDTWWVVDDDPIHARMFDDDALQAARTRAYTTLNLSVREEIIPYIQELIDPKQIWKTLCTQFEGAGASRKMLLRARLQALKHTHGGSLPNYLKNFKDIVNQMAATGIQMDEDEIVMTCLGGLPENYETFIQGIVSRIELPRFENLVNALL